MPKRNGAAELYDVVADPGESNNLAASHPAVVMSLRERAEAWNATLPRAYDKSGAKDD